MIYIYMKPVAITFADSKFTLLAQEQKDNFNRHGLEHVTIPIEEQSYNIELWIKLLDLTVEAIEKYGKIFRVDSEIRMIHDFPNFWTKSNVLFHIDHPNNIINTGHMILDHTALRFLAKLKELTVAMIPKDYNGEKLAFDDEDASYEAIVQSDISYLSEIIDYERNDASRAACTRGDWVTPHTIFVHPYMHNWNVSAHNIGAEKLFRDHFRPTEHVIKADAVILGLKKQVTSELFWKKLDFEVIGDKRFRHGNWIVNPSKSSYMHSNYTTEKFILPSQL